MSRRPLSPRASSASPPAIRICGPCFSTETAGSGVLTSFSSTASKLSAATTRWAPPRSAAPPRIRCSCSPPWREADMPRRTHIAFASDTCLFSPVQMQPASVLRAGMTALASCIDSQLTEWRVLKRDHRTTVVIVGVKLTYLRDFDFFSACHIDVDAGLTVRRSGRFFELGCVLGPADDPFAVLTVLNRPVALSGTEALDATPCS